MLIILNIKVQTTIVILEKLLDCLSRQFNKQKIKEVIHLRTVKVHSLNTL